MRDAPRGVRAQDVGQQKLRSFGAVSEPSNKRCGPEPGAAALLRALLMGALLGRSSVAGAEAAVSARSGKAGSESKSRPAVPWRRTYACASSRGGTLSSPRILKLLRHGLAPCLVRETGVYSRLVRALVTNGSCEVHMSSAFLVAR